MARSWVGDAAFALRDCDAALSREPRNSKAMHRRVLALQELRQLRVRTCLVIGRCDMTGMSISQSGIRRSNA